MKVRTWGDILSYLQKTPPEVLKKEAMIGFDTGIVPVRYIGIITDVTDIDDLEGNTLILETAISSEGITEELPLAS